MRKQIRPPREGLERLVPYDAKEVQAEVVLASNENPRNMPAELMARLAERMKNFNFNRYPDPTAPRLRALIAEANGVDPDNVLVGNGGDELLFLMLLAWGGPGRTLLDMPPTFAMYGIDAEVTGTKVISIPRTDTFDVDQEAVLSRVAEGDVDIIIIANPNNPTGNLTDQSFLGDLLEATDALVCVDEAYFEFSRSTMRPYLDRHKNLVILRTFSKAFSLAALRVGYVLAHPDVIKHLMRVRQPYSVNAFSQWAAQIVYRERMVFEATIYELIEQRQHVYSSLSMMHDVEVFPSEANYIMFRVPNASAVWRDLLHQHSVLIRDLSRNDGLYDCLRVTIGTAQENERFLTALDSVMQHQRATRQSAHANSKES